MSSPENGSELALELSPVKLPWRATLFLKGMRLIEQVIERKKRAVSIKEAKSYERKAAKAETSFEVGTFLLGAGRAYMNARRNDTALERLEEAQPHVEAHKMGGSLYGFCTLATLYQALEFTYVKTGDKVSAETTHDKSVALAGEMEEHFGIHTEFLPNGGQSISSVNNLARNSTAQQAA